MSRVIDADELRNQIKHMPRTVNPDLVQYSLVQEIIANMPTLTPPNERVSRMREIEELHAKLRAVTGCSLEQIIEMFAAGYTLEKPDYSNKTMDRLDETTPPNEWVSVEERLPEDNSEVLMWRKKWKIAEAGTYRKAHFWVYDKIGDSYTADDITHWMLLPAPPAKED